MSNVINILLTTDRYRLISYNFGQYFKLTCLSNNISIYVDADSIHYRLIKDLSTYSNKSESMNTILDRVYNYIMMEENKLYG